MLADTLSRPHGHVDPDPELCSIGMISVDTPARSPAHIREDQTQDDELQKIIACLERGSLEEATPWTNFGYLLN